MARLCAVADGNLTSASTWAVIDSTSYVESESIAITVTTSYSTGYTQFTPGAITIDGFALRLGTRTGTTGTFSAQLYNHTAGAAVAGTEVTINCSDFVDGSTTTNDGGWYFFKLGSSVTLIAANAYSVQVKTSNSTQISILGSGSLSPSRFLRTTTTAAPAAGDDMFVMGEWTAAGTTTTRTVTIDSTASTDYGSAATSSVTPCLSISAGGIVLAGTTASTTYVFKTSGNTVVYNGGILRIATSGSRMPTTSSFTWTIDCATNVDFGILVKRKAEFSGYGESKQRWTLLTADVAASATVIPLTSTSGWKNGDTIVFAPTGTTVTQGETKTISTVDSSTQVTLTGGLTNAHTGSGDVVGEVGNVNCNVKIVGVSTTVGYFIDCQDSSIVTLDNMEFQYYGSGNAGKRGIEGRHVTTGTNSATFSNCSFREISAGTGMVGTSQATPANFTCTANLILQNGTNGGLLVGTAGTSATALNVTITNNLCINLTNASTGLSLSICNASLASGVAGTISGNRIAGWSTGISLQNTSNAGFYGYSTANKVHSCGTGCSGSSPGTRVVDSTDFISCGTGINTDRGAQVTFTSCLIAGCSSTGSSISINSNGQPTNVVFTSCTFRGRTSFAQSTAVSFGSSFNPTFVTFNSCNFGTTIAHTSADITITGIIPSGKIIVNNCTLASTTEFSGTPWTLIESEGSLQVQRKDTTAGAHFTYVKYGVATPDTTIYRNASPSLRLTPKSATVTCDTHLFPFRVPVKSGKTCTPTVYVRESVVGDGTAFNGNHPKLYVKANHNAGITSDTLLATATSGASGAWQALSAATAAVTDDVVLEFYILTDGTTGWINIDDFTAITT